MAYKDNETMRKQNIKYLNTESGFIISKWNDIKKRVNKKNKMKESDGDYRKSAGSKKIAKLEHTLTKEEFLQAWEGDIDITYTLIPDSPTEERHVEVKHSSNGS